jgi:Flp pilus assembly protein TadD
LAPDVRSIYAQAVGHHQAGRLDDAAACYRQVLALEPDLAGAHHNLGNALFAQGKLELAEASYRRALILQPGLASAHNNLGIVLYEQDRLDEAVACYREALFLEPGYVEALNNLGAALCRREAYDEGEAYIRQALVLKPGFTRALHNLGAMLGDQGRLNEAIAIYRQLLQIRPEDIDGLNGLAYVLAAQGDAARALETILQSLRIKETASAKRIFVNIARQLSWAKDNREVRSAMARALTDPWARPDELAHTSAGLTKQSTHIGASVARAARAWPRPLSAEELFGSGGPKIFAEDGLLLALMVSAQNTDVELERFFTMARRLLLEGAADETADGAGLEFYAALARQCFINEYVFFHDAEEIHRAGALRDALVLALEAGTPISSLRLVAVGAYFPLHSLSNAARLLDRA